MRGKIGGEGNQNKLTKTKKQQQTALSHTHLGISINFRWVLCDNEPFNNIKKNIYIFQICKTSHAY